MRTSRLSPIRLRDLRPGDRITGFVDWGCIGASAVRVVQRGREGLFVACSQGRHYLESQCVNFFEPGEDDTLVGISRVGAGALDLEANDKVEESKE